MSGIDIVLCVITMIFLGLIIAYAITELCKISQFVLSDRRRYRTGLILFMMLMTVLLILEIVVVCNRLGI